MDKRIIYIDGWFLKPPLRGIGKYIKNILISIPKNYEGTEFVLLLSQYDSKLLALPYHLKVKVIPTKFILFWYEYQLPSLLKKTNNSTIFFPSGICSIFNFPKKSKVISTIHDVASFLPLKSNPITYRLRPIIGRIYRKLSFYKLIKNSQYIFTVSETAKDGIKKIVNRKKLKIPIIFTVYNASEMDDLPKTIKKKKSFLCITGENSQKNYKCIVKSLEFLDNNILDGWTIYLVGLNQDIDKRHKCGAVIKKRRYQDNKKLKDLYYFSYCLIFPSFFESFGIPLVDAMKSKCQIIASKGGASFEVCGESAFYFDPYSPKNLSEKIIEIKNTYPKILQKHYENIILNQTWEKSSESIFKIISQNN